VLLGVPRALWEPPWALLEGIVSEVEETVFWPQKAMISEKLRRLDFLKGC